MDAQVAGGGGRTAIAGILYTFLSACRRLAPSELRRFILRSPASAFPTTRSVKFQVLVWMSMGSFREGPREGQSERIREKAEVAFRRKIDRVRVFAIQRGPDVCDFGSDYQLEVR